MNIARWIVSGLLPGAYFVGRAENVALSGQLAEGSNLAVLVQIASPAAIKAIGSVVVAAAFGSIAPRVTGTPRILISAAAPGLVFAQAGKILFHARGVNSAVSEPT